MLQNRCMYSWHKLHLSAFPSERNTRDRWFLILQPLLNSIIIIINHFTTILLHYGNFQKHHQTYQYSQKPRPWWIMYDQAPWSMGELNEHESKLERRRPIGDHAWPLATREPNQQFRTRWFKNICTVNAISFMALFSVITHHDIAHQMPKWYMHVYAEKNLPVFPRQYANTF